MGKTILIIGGTKFIGPYVVRRLSGLGHDVLLYHRGENESAPTVMAKHVRSAHASIPVTRFDHVLFELKPDLVIHMIAMGEADSRAAFDAFNGRVEKMVWLSSGDVYAAYGRFAGFEAGEVNNELLTENAPLRTQFFPYRQKSVSKDDLNYYYEKICVEQIALSDRSLPGVVLRLPKVYGPGSNSDLSTVYRYRHQPQWRWTHGFVENVAEAIVIAALGDAANGRIYNVGEEYTPTVAERLAYLPWSSIMPDDMPEANFSQDIAYDTIKIRRELGFQERVPEPEAMRKTAEDFIQRREAQS